MNFEAVRHAMSPEWLPWIAALFGLVLGAATLEGLVQQFLLRQAYDWRAYAASLGDALGRFAIDSLGLSVVTPVLLWVYAHRLGDVPLNTVTQWLLLFFLEEFLYYWYHRSAHRVRWFWATHAVHHSPNELTLAASLRLGWTGKLTGTGLFFCAAVVVGFCTVCGLRDAGGQSAVPILATRDLDSQAGSIGVGAQHPRAPSRPSRIQPRVSG